MQHMPENWPISIKKWWRLRSLLENECSNPENETIPKSSDAEPNTKTSKYKNIQAIPLDCISSQTDFPLCQDVDNQVTDSSTDFVFPSKPEKCSKFVDTPMNVLEDDTTNQYPPDMLKFPKGNIVPETCTNRKFLNKETEIEIHKEGGGRVCHHYLSRMEGAWNSDYPISQINGNNIRPIIIPTVYSENRDIPPLLGFVSCYDFERLRFLQYNGSHSMYGTEEIKYHLTRKDETRAHLAVSLENANYNKQKMVFNQGSYLSNNIPYVPSPFISVPNSTSVMEWPVSDSCKDSSVEHLTTVDPVERPHVCHVCGKAFGQKRYLLNHLSVHSGEKRYLCEICQKNFSHKSNLVKHLKVHSGERPYSCHMCDKRFVQKIHLVNHMTVHSGERPYLCHICQKRFSYKSNLVKHIKLHSGKKPFACSICDKRFTQKVNLMMHQKLHEKGPFTCVICQKKFLYESSLAKHVIAHNGEKPYACNFCEKKFIQKANLAKHLKVHKTETP